MIFKRLGLCFGLGFEASFPNCKRMVQLIFFATALRTLPSEYMSLEGETGNPVKTSGAMCLYTSLYFLAFGLNISHIIRLQITVKIPPLVHVV